MDDSRNVTDEFKGMPIADIVARLDEGSYPLEIAVENTIRDFNMGSIVRTANALGIRTVHVVGRRQWNKRGAMMTDKYLHIVYHEDAVALRGYATDAQKVLIAIDNVPGSVPMGSLAKHPDSILLFGQEGPGLSREIIAVADAIVAIEQQGSTRSLNVAAAAAIAMYQWCHINQTD